MENKSHYERIVGGSEEDKEAALQELQRCFEEKDERLLEYTVEKTEEEKQIIEEMVVSVDKIVKKYGGDPKPLPMDKVVVLQENGLEKITDGKISGGIHRPLGQNIGAERQNSHLGFASSVAHELFHLKSYKSARVGRGSDDVRLYRSGISMVDKKDPEAERGKEKVYFDELEEAIVAECTKRLLESGEIQTNPLFVEEVQARDKFLGWIANYFRNTGKSEETIQLIVSETRYIPNAQERVKQVEAENDDEGKRASYATGMFHRFLQDNKIGEMERYKERSKLYKLLDEIIEKSGGKFKDRDEIFTEFAKANFSGRYLPLARTIEGVLGKGSFRQLAEEFARPDTKNGTAE